jgi:hypothetical protein
MSKSRKKILLTTNHLLHFSGSEVVLLEAAEYFRQKDYEISVFTHVMSAALRAEFDRIDTVWIKDPAPTCLFDFDVVWAQHRMLPLFDFAKSRPDRDETLIIGARLSPFEPFEAPGGAIEESLQDLTVVNSEETAQAMSAYGIDPAKTRIFHNAAPAGFCGERVQSAGLKKILLISNHAPPEIRAAMDILKNQCMLDVTHIGLGGQPQRVTPEVIQSADLVLTIGKTVQYALMSAVPVYCYDHFGGPGYITEANYEDARVRNFSGRGWTERKTPQMIAQEIVAQFVKAREFAGKVKTTENSRFRLDAHIDAWLETAVRPNDVKRRYVQENHHLLLRERANARLIAREYRRALRPAG